MIFSRMFFVMFLCPCRSVGNHGIGDYEAQRKGKGPLMQEVGLIYCLFKGFLALVVERSEKPALLQIEAELSRAVTRLSPETASAAATGVSIYSFSSSVIPAQGIKSVAYPLNYQLGLKPRPIESGGQRVRAPVAVFAVLPAEDLPYSPLRLKG